MTGHQDRGEANTLIVEAAVAGVGHEHGHPVLALVAHNSEGVISVSSGHSIICCCILFCGCSHSLNCCCIFFCFSCIHRVNCSGVSLRLRCSHSLNCSVVNLSLRS